MTNHGKFEDHNELRKWLENQGIDEIIATNSAKKLFDAEYKFPSSFYGVKPEDLKVFVGLDPPTAGHLCGILLNQQQQNAQPCWDFGATAELTERDHLLPPPGESRRWIGRLETERMVEMVASQNFNQRTMSTDHNAKFTFLVASGHVRSGKTRTGHETPRIVTRFCSELEADRKKTDNVVFCKCVYLKIDFLNAARFNAQFDDDERITPSEALGARLMNAFYETTILRRATHDEALAHIVTTRRGSHGNPDAVVPIVIHFDEHGEFIRAMNDAYHPHDQNKKDAPKNRGKMFFLEMLKLIGSAATTSNDSALSELHKAGMYFIVPITTGTSYTDANLAQLSNNHYQLRSLPLPPLTSVDVKVMAQECLSLQNDGEHANATLEQSLFNYALGDTGGLPGLVDFACSRPADLGHISYVQYLHRVVAEYVRQDWSSGWEATTSIFLARPSLNPADELEDGYTMRDALDSGTVYYRRAGELGLAPALLAQYNWAHKLFNPILIKEISNADDWTWQQFELAHLLFLAATMSALIKESGRFESITLGTLLRHVSPAASTALSQELTLPTSFNSTQHICDQEQCIPKSGAKNSKRHSVQTGDTSSVHQAASGTPIVDGYLNLKLGGLRGPTTLFVQYKHSRTDSQRSDINVSTMNAEVKKLRTRLIKHRWESDCRFLLLWVTNRCVIPDETPDENLLWVDQKSLCDHAPLLGYRGLVPIETHRDDDDV